MSDKIRDIVPAHKRTIRDVPVPSSRRSRKRTAEEPNDYMSADDTMTEENLDNRNFGDNRPSSGRGMARWWLWGIAFLCLAGVVFAFSTFFTSAKIDIEPKKQTERVDLILTASREGKAESDLKFELAKIDDEKKIVIEGTPTQGEVSTAEGTLTVFNSFSSDPIALVDRTRFEAPGGKIYRAKNAFTIPGGSENNPGQIEVAVVADEAGPEYNLREARLTVPGLKGDPMFNGVYAEISESLSGGSDGTGFTVEEEELSSRLDLVENELREQLLSNFSDQVPEGYIFLNPFQVFSFSEKSREDIGDGQVEIVVEGSVSAALFDQDVLSDIVARLLISNISPEERVRIENLEELNISLVGESFDPALTESFEVSVSGEAVFIWEVNTQKITEEIRGLNKEAVGGFIYENYSVEKVNAVVRPLWKKTLPEDLEDIEIIISDN